MSTFTVLGGGGFIGRNLASQLKQRGIDVRTPRRGEELRESELRHVVYCIGLTADFRTRQSETVEAHVCLLRSLLEHTQLESLVYLSSTRLYAPGKPGREDGRISADPGDPSDTYNLSKALGEALTLHGGSHRGLVVRLSNVFGVDPGSLNFLPSIINDALHGEIVLRTGLGSSKDYIGVDDAVSAVISLMNREASGIFNVASGTPITHGAITDALSALSECSVRVLPGAPTETSPEISVKKLRGEIQFEPTSLLAALPGLVHSYASIPPGSVRQSV